MYILPSLGLFIIRLITGLTMIGHGTQKLFGWFGGPGLKGMGEGMKQMGMKNGLMMALFAGLSEAGGGVLFILGFLTPLASLLIVIPMIVAIQKVHLQNGFFSSNGGYEFPLNLLVVAIGVAVAGPGGWALDALIF